MSRLSICVLIYNSKKFIPACMNCLLKQTDKNFEIVLINNASEDGSIPLAISILEENKFTNYKVVNIEKNTGSGQGRTEGYKGASGEYIKNLDSDDILPPYFVEKINQVISKSSPDIIAYGHDVVDLNGNLIRHMYPFKDELFTKYTLTMFWRYTFKKQIAIDANVNTSGMHYGEDRRFSLMMMPYIKTVKIINAQMYNYYRNPNSTTKTMNQDKFYKSNKGIFEEYGKLYASLEDKKEKKILFYAITKFYISILSANCKGEKDKINKYFDLYKQEYLKALNQRKYKRFFIIPKHSFSKETFVIQTAYHMLKLHFKGLFKYVFGKMYK